MLDVYINNAGSLIWNTIIPAKCNRTDNKLALKYKSGDYALWLNGVEIDTTNNTGVMNVINQINFTTNAATSTKFFGKTKCTCSLERGFKR